MSKKDIKSWLAKQALWKIHTPHPKEIHHPHYDVRKPNEQHQFDLLYMPRNLFEENTYKYILTGIDVGCLDRWMLKSFKTLKKYRQFGSKV